MGCSPSLLDNGVHSIDVIPHYSDTAKLKPGVAAGVPLPSAYFVESCTGKFKSPEDEDEDDVHFSGEYDFVITEHSSPEKVQRVREEFLFPENKESLVLEGKGCPRRTTPKERDRIEQQQILEKLRKEGLVLRPESRSAGGMRFEIVSKEELVADFLSPTVRQLPPIRLRRKKRKKELTRQEIDEKLDKAEDRRKQQEEEKLRRLGSKSHLVDVAKAFVKQSRQRKMKEKMESTTKSREQQMKELQERLRTHHEHAEKVRRRKEMLKLVPELEDTSTAGS